MTLYTRKKGNYVEVTPEQLRRMRRVNEVVALQKCAVQSASTLRAMAGWMEAVVRNNGSLKYQDQHVLRVPNVLRIRKQAETMAEAAKALERV